MPLRSARPASLHTRLFSWLMVPVLLLLPLLGLLLFDQIERAANSSLDEALEDIALTLAAQFDSRSDEPRIEISNPMDKALRFDSQDEILYVAVAPGQRPLLGDAALLRVQPAPEALAAGQHRQSNVQLEGRELRLVQLGTPCGPHTCQVLVAETLRKRHTLLAEIGADLIVIGIALALLMAAAVWWAIRQGLQPVTALSLELEQRDLHRLQPLASALPEELTPLQAAFNRLFDRLARAAEAQREFLADAAHQLRTPLTTLRTEIELAMLELNKGESALDVNGLLGRLQQRVDRSARLAQQLLALARSEANTEPPVQNLDLRDVAAQLGEDWARRELPVGLDLGFELAPAAVRGDAFLLRELLENLVHNAVNYAGPVAQVTVRCGSTGPEAWIEVEDNGPGIAPEDRPSALQRFRRGKATAGTGSGLGLAIAADIASRHGGRLDLLDGAHGRGLRVRLSLPGASP